MKRALEEPIPIILFDLYDNVLSNVTQATCDSQQTVFTVLSWLFHAKRPLQMSELQEVLAISEGDAELDPDDRTPPAEIVQACGNFVIYDPMSGIVGFSHDEVRKYLENRHACDLLKDVDMAITCLTYLLFDAFEEGLCSDEHSFVNRTNRYPFGQYAACYWGVYTKGLGEKNPKIHEMLLTLMKSPKRDSMEQLYKAQRSEDWNLHIRHRSKTLLHVIAENDLTIMAKMLLDASICTVTSQSPTALPISSLSFHSFSLSLSLSLHRVFLFD